MDYLYENLGDERFQEFCHCLVNNEFPDSQALPVGQPDGGRDSIAYNRGIRRKEFIIFQVKFVRNAHHTKDIHKWLVQTIEKEVEKIKKLIPKGAISYYLITNVKGTAHLDAGAIDKLNKVLDDKIPIPSFCWWRDDLSRKLESSATLKWSFPEILNGQDILNSIIFEQLHENKERRENVIRAYLADQYEMDNEVKFKQIELQNRLLDLFIDVPIRIKKYGKKNKSLKKILWTFQRYHKKHIGFDEFFDPSELQNIGAASFLLSQLAQDGIERILLEGGPGQGKSTISQYICQVQRIRLLNKEEHSNSIPSHLRNVPIRLPFKIDLRDVASWVEKKNPYQGTLSDEFFTKTWAKSLESFFVANICYHSKITDFNSSDFISICRLSSILFVFDGFDEIANLNVRKDIIDFINKGLNRLRENSKSIQVIITSRPAAFSSSTGFAIEEYPHFELTDINSENTKDYVEKWIKARKLRSREANEIRRLVEDKLEMPHLRDLAKSPMQLAILISLLNTRGESLPNKRTALYDSYIELFFNREAEKSITIRDNRDLIIDIHKYLAWILHSEAERYKNSGRIDINSLKQKLKEYLEREGHETNIADQLFTVMKERVCAIVSRVQGSFEFEVQPLREYFCAKYLYETSPYSPAGCERKGTKPERFDAIARNFYWHNVVRFFAGCFDKGELPMLIQKLNELQDDEILKYTNYPRLITAQLLSDWVFTQYPVLLKNVIRIIINGINIGDILNQDSKSSNNEPIVLPEECGRQEIVEECFNQLKNFPNSDYVSELIGLIINNPYKTLDYWENYAHELEADQLTIWLEYAYRLQILHRIDQSFLLQLLKKDSSNDIKRLQILINGNRFDIIENNTSLKKNVFSGILEGNIHVIQRGQNRYSLKSLTLCLSTFLLGSIFDIDTDSDVPFADFMTHNFLYTSHEGEKQFSFGKFNVADEIDRQVQDFFKLIRDALIITIPNWKNSIRPWDIIVEAGRKSFNDSWCFYLIAVVAAGIKSKSERCEEYADFEDHSISLCKRVRYARLKSGNITWWRTQIETASNLEFTLLIFFTWATPKTINSLLPLSSEKVETLGNENRKRLLQGLNKVTCVSTFTQTQQRLIVDEVNKNEYSELIKYILSLRFSDINKQRFIYNTINDFSKNIDSVLKIKLDFLISQFFRSPNKEAYLSDIKKVYCKLNRFDEKNHHYRRYRYIVRNEMPYEIAKKIMSDCKSYPRFIASWAESSCRNYANTMLKPIGEIAESDKWFSIDNDHY